jgi:GLPGLI family protein
MKYLLFLLFFTSFLYSQSKEDKVYSITYLNTFKDRISYNYPAKEYSRLLVNGNTSIYQIYNVMKLDTLRKLGKVTESDKNKYFSYFKHSIFIKEKKLTYNDAIYKDQYFYEEVIDYQWKIGNDVKTISGYECKNATLSYGGREWQAWFSLELPIDAGPYKFKGLPGLIIKITDSTKTYDFELYAIVERDLKPLKKFYHKIPESEWIRTERLAFNKIKANFESLSLNEKMSYGTPGVTAKVVMVGNEDFFEMRDPKKTGKAEDYNPIEIDYKD